LRRFVPHHLANLLAWLIAAVPAAADAQPPWHLDGWSCRAAGAIPQPSAEPGVDTAVVRVLCQGRAQEDGDDYRVLDAAGDPIPFALLFHDAARYSLIAFRVGDPAQAHYVYFDNPQAVRAAEAVPLTLDPGSGPPAGDWTPQCLVYQTLVRPQGDNPTTVEELAALLAGSPGKYGARVQRAISDGYNPFGPSDYFLSVYRGWIEIPADGEYKFCTASNEASFSFLDGKELIHWPGRHTAERGSRGEKNAAVTLTAGRHYVEYYHEEVTLDQMAFLGWSAPSTPLGAFSGIPVELFPAPHDAQVQTYEESGGGLLVRFEPAIVDSIWPETRHEGQYTRVRFAVANPEALAESERGALHWIFGDGTTATGGPEIEHVYLSLGQFHVTLTSDLQDSAALAQWPLEVYEVQHVTDQIGGGSLAEYATVARGYPRDALDAPSLAELAHLLAEAGDTPAAVEVGTLFVERHAAAEPARASKIRRLLAECALAGGEGGLDEAISNYQASITDDMPATERLEVLTRLVQLVGVDRGEPQRADELLAQVDETVRGLRLDDDGRAAHRRAVIAAGDAHLWQGELPPARKLYARAEKMSRTQVPDQVRSARIGAYPNAIRETLSGGDRGAALDLVRQWEESFPTEKLHGQTLFWRGKLLALDGRAREAARHLARAVGLGVGASFETEARWLLAGALEELNRPDDARAELEKLVATGANDEFARRAAERLKRP
jgi:tetratricopeptide (TPR) repeat protein